MNFEKKCFALDLWRLLQIRVECTITLTDVSTISIACFWPKVTDITQVYSKTQMLEGWHFKSLTRSLLSSLIYLSLIVVSYYDLDVPIPNLQKLQSFPFFTKSSCTIFCQSLEFLSFLPVSCSLQCTHLIDPGEWAHFLQIWTKYGFILNIYLF